MLGCLEEQLQHRVPCALRYSSERVILTCAVTGAGTLSDYQFMRRHTGSSKRAEKAKEAWGASLNSLQDVYRVFTKYTSGRSPSSPAVNSWCHHLAYLSSAVRSVSAGCCKLIAGGMQYPAHALLFSACPELCVNVLSKAA